LFCVTALWVIVAMIGLDILGDAGIASAQEELSNDMGLRTPTPWNEVFTLNVLVKSAFLLAFSAFFSASEVAYFSLHKLQLRTMRQGAKRLDRMAGRLMEHPGNLLTTILMGNCIVNVLLSITFAVPVERLFKETFQLGAVLGYVMAVVITTTVLVIFGEVAPKLIVVRMSEPYARYSAMPLFFIDRGLNPVRRLLILFTGLLFRLTHFSDVKPAPFMTDEEFMVLLSDSEAAGAIEEDERAMIQGILEFGDATVREILVPRPDITAIQEEATVGEALELLREHERSRMPVYGENLDKITGVLYAKDLLTAVEEGDLSLPVLPMLRKVHYVPETMTVSDFLKMAQRLRTHVAIVVDEYGGTEGLVTLQDALREVVGDIGEEHEDEVATSVEGQQGVYDVEGGFPLDELEELTGVPVPNDEHTTIAGFMMEQTDKILEDGDRISFGGVDYSVEEMDGKRVSRIRIQIPSQDGSKDEGGGEQ
jgi:CBS domain containing-hemolysin-like protein